MEINTSTLGGLMSRNAETVEETIAEVVNETETNSDLNISEPATASNEAATTNNNEPAATTEPAATAEVTQEEDSTEFSMPSLNGEEATTETATPENKTIPASWQETIKSVNKAELLKELGYDEFVLEFAEFRKNGGDPYKYLEAKAFDWTKVPHENIVMDELKRTYPSMPQDKLQKLYENKYSLSEYADESQKEIGLIQLEADAENIRQKRIAEQQSFKIPEIAVPQGNMQDQQAQLEAERQQAAQIEATQQFYQTHAATKNLIDSKRVAINLGDIPAFNFKIDKPEQLQQVILDGATWQKVTSTPQGEPDVELLQQLALHAANKNYNKDLVNYGISIGKRMLIKEGQNAVRPIGNAPANIPVQTGTVVKGSGTVGAKLNQR